MSCYRSSNNKHFTSAPRMADGRNFTDYRPNHELNRHIIEENKLGNSHEFRMFLNRNGEHIINKNREYTFTKNGNINCKQPYEVGTMLPEKTRIVCDQHQCKEVEVNPNGLGQGRAYYVENNALLSPLTKPEYELGPNLCAQPGDNFNYYPINKDLQNSVEMRPALPSGGNILNGGDPKYIN